jgi:glycosyltransferase involved in cell wall biosynthesis
VVSTHRAQPAIVVPNGIAADAQTFIPPSRRGSSDVLFIGSYFWPPNIKAARFLAREVMPRVWATRPEARLVLCGRSPSIEVAFLRNPRVEVTGTVPDVRPYLDRAAVYANALFEGGGSSLKVLEPLACGIPLVSTTVGVRGFPLIGGKHYLPANNADEFAAAILHVFDNRDSFDGQAGHARTVAEEHDWGPIARRFAELVTNVIQVGSG